MPARITPVASVVMKLGVPTYATNTPLIRPNRPAHTNVRATAQPHPQPWLTISTTTRAPAADSMLDTDRSKSPITSTTVRPRAMISSGEPVASVVRRLATVETVVVGEKRCRRTS